MAVRSLPVPSDIAPMEARLVESLPEGPGWQFEPKWDGFRCLAFRAGDEVELRAKSGKPLARYFPDVAALLRGLPLDRFALDGELAIPVGDTLSFDALQARLHPAESRVRKLVAEAPAILILFDALAIADESLLAVPLHGRRAALERLHAAAGAHQRLKLSSWTADRGEAEEWLDRGGGTLDGVIAKRRDDVYHPGERAMVKVKRLRSADCVVGGFRYASRSREVGSLLLGLYDESGKLDHVGFTATIAHAERPALTRRLEALIEPPGFTGKAPGGPSRWSGERSAEWHPLRPALVVEIRYDQVTGNRFRHGTTLLRWRPDKAPRQCTFEQLQRPGWDDTLAGADGKGPRQPFSRSFAAS
ncbi:MAG: ATP-dependent DNA ligase [Alphaproteobacteria bacterium]|nr:ATP-dependent DNA ligase [Alphaproteobacteria bacterium]